MACVAGQLLKLAGFLIRPVLYLAKLICVYQTKNACCLGKFCVLDQSYYFKVFFLPEEKLAKVSAKSTVFPFFLFFLSLTVRNSGFTVKLNPSGVFFFLFLFQNSSLFNTNHYLHVNLLVGVFFILMISKAWFSFYCMFELDFLMD